MEELDIKKTKYFVIAIIILIILGVILIIHFNNKELVNGDIDETTSTTTTNDIIPITTTSITTTKKRQVNNKEEVIIEELVNEEAIYKSIIDEKTEIVYNYKLTNEISNNDKFISTKLNVDNNLLINNVISLYDISLYDEYMNKKIVNNSLISIKIPIKDELVGYDEYKIVYINESNKITDEKFDVKVIDNYIEFNTNHLSVFGIIGIKNVTSDKTEEIVPEIKPDEDIKKEIDLSEVDVVLNINGNDFTFNKDNTLLLSKEDQFDIKVSGIDNEYQIYYSLISENMGNDYELFNENILKDLPTNIIYNLKLKIVVEDKFVEFDMGYISVYDIVYINDNKVVEETIGTIYNEDGTDYLYDNEEINKDIVIDNGDKVIVNKTKEEIIVEKNNGNICDNIVVNDDLNKENNSEIEESDIKIKVNGNIYLVEETDISNLEMTGYLIIDTSENITFETYEEKVLLSNLYTITVRSKEFSLNGVKYTYEYDLNGNLVIKKIDKVTVDDNTEIKETVITDEFKNLFDDVELDKNENNELVIEKNKKYGNELVDEKTTQEELESKKIEETIIN